MTTVRCDRWMVQLTVTSACGITATTTTTTAPSSISTTASTATTSKVLLANVTDTLLVQLRSLITAYKCTIIIITVIVIIIVIINL